MVIGARLCRELIEIVIKKKGGEGGGGEGRNPGLAIVQRSSLLVYLYFRELYRGG